MPNTVLTITIDPGGVSVAVNITNPQSLSFTAYTTRDGSTAVTFPVTISQRTVFYMDTARRYNVSLVGPSGENADGSGGVAALDLRGGQNASLGYVSTAGKGTYAPLDARDTSITSFTVGMLVSSGSSIYRVTTAHAAPFDSTKATQQGGTSVALTPTTKTTAYTAAVNDLVLADTTSAGFTVTLPTAPATGALVGVKKISGDTNTLTIAAAGGGTIDGSATATTVTQWAGVELQHVGSNVWRVVASMSTTGPAGTNGTNGVNAALSIVQDEGVALTQRDTINFTGAGVTASDAGGKTVVNIPGGGSSATGLLPRAHRSGKYVTTPGQLQNCTLSRGYMYWFPFEVYATTTYTQFVLNVVTAQTSSVGRVGMYADSSGAPGALLFEATSTTQLDLATTGQKTSATFSQALAAGIYWVGFLAYGGTADPVLSGTQAMPVVISSNTIAGAVQNVAAGYNDAGGNSTLPATATGLGQATVMPRVALLVA